MVRGKAGEDVPWLQMQRRQPDGEEPGTGARGGGVPVLELVEARVSDANLDLARRQVDVAGCEPGRRQVRGRRATSRAWWIGKPCLLVEEDVAAGPPAAPKPAGAEAAAPMIPWKIGRARNQAFRLGGACHRSGLCHAAWPYCRGLPA